MTTSQKLKQQLADAQEQARENLQYQASLKDAIATAQKREQAEAAEQQRLATVAARSESVRKLAELVPRINQSSSQFQKMLLEARAIAAEAGRHRDALRQVAADDALLELRELAPQFNSDSERLADSLSQANELIRRCDESAVRCDWSYQPEQLPMLLETPEGKVILRRRGV